VKFLDAAKELLVLLQHRIPLMAENSVSTTPGLITENRTFWPSLRQGRTGRCGPGGHLLGSGVLPDAAAG
jgi:hypothetical protein